MDMLEAMLVDLAEIEKASQRHHSAGHAVYRAAKALHHGMQSKARANQASRVMRIAYVF